MGKDFTLLSWYKNKSDRKNSVGRKCCQLKALKLLTNKTTGSDNRHFFFNTLKNENKEFLTYNTFCTLEQIEKKYITEANIPG